MSDMNTWSNLPALPDGYYWNIEQFEPIEDLGRIQICKRRRFRRDIPLWSQYIRNAVRFPQQAHQDRANAAEMVRGFKTGHAAT